jgi:hypothetical protein
MFALTLAVGVACALWRASVAVCDSAGQAAKADIESRMADYTFKPIGGRLTGLAPLQVVVTGSLGNRDDLRQRVEVTVTRIDGAWRTERQFVGFGDMPPAEVRG